MDAYGYPLAPRSYAENEWAKFGLVFPHEEQATVLVYYIPPIQEGKILEKDTVRCVLDLEILRDMRTKVWSKEILRVHE